MVLFYSKKIWNFFLDWGLSVGTKYPNAISALDDAYDGVIWCWLQNSKHKELLKTEMRF